MPNVVGLDNSNPLPVRGGWGGGFNAGAPNAQSSAPSTAGSASWRLEDALPARFTSLLTRALGGGDAPCGTTPRPRAGWVAPLRRRIPGGGARAGARTVCAVCYRGTERPPSAGARPSRRHPVQIQIKAVFNQCHPLPGFVAADIRMIPKQGRQAAHLEIRLAAHAGRPARCSHCQAPAPTYDHLRPRTWLFVPLWNYIVLLLYAARRVQCPTHGVVVEHLPWSEGKRPVARAMMLFLAQWARRLSWRETAQMFHTSWENVFRSVAWVVAWGRAHRELGGITALGVDEIHWGRGKKAAQYLTVIYQIDAHCRRLLWVGPRRTEQTLRQGLAALGPEVVRGLRFVCSDMWRPYLNVLKAQAGHALHILDRFHIAGHLNTAVDEVRRAETTRWRGAAGPQAGRLKKMRWKLLRRGKRVRGRARAQLQALVASKQATGRAWLLKETFEHFWSYRSVTWAKGFLGAWTTRALRSRLEPLQRVARMLRNHEALLLNWFRAKGEFSNAVSEGLNNKIRVVTRRSYGFRTYNAMETALYHTLGKLPEPDEFTHRFC